mgnify:CR=1 FL=1
MSSSELDGYISILNIRQKFIRQNLIITTVVAVGIMLVPLYFVATRFEGWMLAYMWAMGFTSASGLITNARMEQMLNKSQIELLQELRQIRRDS